jgi:hypothetical protein
MRVTGVSLRAQDDPTFSSCQSVSYYNYGAYLGTCFGMYEYPWYTEWGWEAQAIADLQSDCETFCEPYTHWWPAIVSESGHYFNDGAAWEVDSAECACTT